MGLMQLEVVINTDELDTILARLNGMDDMIAEMSADEVSTVSQKAVPVDTGALKASEQIHVYGPTWFNSYTTSYAAYVELGTTKMSAQSYLRIALVMINWVSIVERAARSVGL